MRAFTFENATKIYFGGGCVKEHLLEAVKPYGETVMLAYGGGSIKTNGIYQEVMDVLKLAGKQVIEFSGIMPNPTYSKVMEGKKVVQENQVDLILAVGGGSVMDCSKAISMAAATDKDVWEEYWIKKGEIDFRSKKIELPEVKKFNFWNSKNLTSGGKEVLPLEVKNFAPNYNNNNYNNQSYNSINPSNLSNQRDQSCKDEMDKSDAYIQQIKKNLDYDFYMTNDVAYMDKDLLKELFDLICDVVCAKSEIIKISGDVYSRDYVRSKFLRLTSEHVMYVMDCIKNTTTKIANIKAYLLVALFNAPSTISHYYQQEVKHYTDSDIQGVG